MSSTQLKGTVVDKALHYFNVEGWNCAESVYMAIFREYYNIDVTPKTVTAYGGIRKFRDQNLKENLCTPLIKKIIDAFLQTVENNKLE
jgi:hypothetical protein